MGALQVLSCAGALISFVISLKVGSSIADDVNNALGTHYDKFWSSRGNTIWNEHKRLFPSSRKRAFLSTSVIVAVSLLTATAFLAR